MSRSIPNRLREYSSFLPSNVSLTERRLHMVSREASETVQSFSEPRLLGHEEEYQQSLIFKRSRNEWDEIMTKSSSSTARTGSQVLNCYGNHKRNVNRKNTQPVNKNLKPEKCWAKNQLFWWSQWEVLLLLLLFKSFIKESDFWNQIGWAEEALGRHE